MIKEYNTKSKIVWKNNIDYPSWMVEESLQTLDSDYLLPGETPKTGMERVARRAAELLDMPRLKEPLFESLWKGWICLSTPIWCNFGATRALPISCFGSHIVDSLDGIYSTLKENAIMTQKGGGTSSYWGSIRDEGDIIHTNGGVASGPFSFTPMYDSTMAKVTQGKTRRGSHASYQEFSSPSFWDWIKFKDVGSSITELFPAICLQEQDEKDIINGEPEALKRWAALLDARTRTGLPYIFSAKNANKSKTTPPWYGEDSKYSIRHTNLCTEIMLPDSGKESFVCCLASMNLAKWDEWKDTKAVRGAIYLLEAVMTEFIEKTEGNKAMSKARNFAINHRALGLGVLGWHTFLQSKNQPFTGIYANSMTRVMMGNIKQKAERASEKLAEFFGNCPVIENYNKEKGMNVKRRHTTLLAIAPTTSNAAIMGGVSAGIEPWVSNVFFKNLAKGKFLSVNPYLKELLASKGKDNTEVWDSIKDAGGSVQHLDFLLDEEKEVFLTFGEINQFDIVKQAALRQEFLDQGQSLNLKIHPATNPKNVSMLYLMGLQLGIKAFYYQRSENVLRAGLNTMDAEACASCAG
jgi:ribonucleoside-diphosphate reductase alpha chain